MRAASRLGVKLACQYPEDTNIMNILGGANAALGKDATDSKFYQALWLKPDAAEIYSNLGVSLKNINDGASHPMPRKAIVLNPLLAQAYNNLGNVNSKRVDILERQYI